MWPMVSLWVNIYSKGNHSGPSPSQIRWQTAKSSCSFVVQSTLEYRSHEGKDINCGSNQRAPSKRGVCTYFIAIVQVAQNPLKFGMPTLFVLRNVHVLFSTQGNKASNTFLKVHPCPPLLPPPSPLLLSPPPPPHPTSNSVKHTRTVFWLARIEILCCLDMDRERGGGGGGGAGFVHNILHIILPSW